MNSISQFIDGNSTDLQYSSFTETGLPVQGNIGSILLSNNKNAKCVNNLSGLCNESSNITNNNNVFVNNIPSPDGDWIIPKDSYVKTPKLNTNVDSLTGESLLQPSDFKLNNKINPELYGVSSFGVDNINLLDSTNNIGNEISYLNSKRVLSEGKYSTDEISCGSLVPNLIKNKDNNICVPSNNYYQVGDWKTTDNNFYSKWIDSVS